MTTELAQKLEGVRDFKKILETVVKELGETYSADLSQIVLSNPLDRNITSICEHKLYPEVVPQDLPVSMSFPLPLEGPGLGAVTLARKNPFHENEVNWIRITLAELCDIIRHAQINDIVQRETFRNTFLFEIQTLMQYSLGLGDALFMVVNILGKVLQASRCLFICVDDTQAGWKAYEFWQRDRLQSCQDYGWPTTDSPIVARSLLTTSPLVIHEANQNSHLTPAQEELQLLGVRSLLGVPLRSESATHGCIIVQHCESRHAWTRGEIDMVQNVADTVAEALSKLPEEKRAREPIMRLHQREVVQAGEEKESIIAVRKALRSALINTSIPSAQKSGVPKAPAPKAVAPTPTPAVAAATPPAPLPAPEVAPPAIPPAANTAQDLSFTPPSPGIPTSGNSSWASDQGQQQGMAPNAVPDSLDNKSFDQLADDLKAQASAERAEADADEVSSSLQNLLNGLRASGSQQIDTLPGKKPDVPTASPAADATSGGAPSAWAAEGTPPTTGAQGNQYSGSGLDAIPPTGTTSGATEAQQASGANAWGDLDSIGSQATTTDSIPAHAPPPVPTAAQADSAWGNLDSIPTPAGGGNKKMGGLLNRRAGNAPASPLLASLHRDKSRFAQEKVEFVDGGTIQIDEVQAEAKLKELLSTTNPSSDYVFATAGVDARMLGRIDGWLTQVEAKDKYDGLHGMQVAEYSVAVGRLLGLPQPELDKLRLAGIVHDVGKLGLPQQVLQKPEDELSDSELLLIMKHPIDGANLLEGFPELAHVAPIVLAHHEEYDGNGYPAGLDGEKIPLAARIIHIASDYHGMVCQNRWRPAMSPVEAQQTLLAGSGKAYDPALVQILIACVQQGMVAAIR